MTTYKTDTKQPLITLVNCCIEDGQESLQTFSWNMNPGESWLITGPNGGGKNVFAKALAGQYIITPKTDGLYSNIFAGSTILVSFEAAAELIEEERARDDSDYIEGGVDQGRTPHQLIIETLAQYSKCTDIESNPAITLCGLEHILDRGLKYLSTGEIRRTLLCRAIMAQPALIVLDEPFDGLDSDSRNTFCKLLEKMTMETSSIEHPVSTRLLVLMDRFDQIPAGINKVLELSEHHVSFSGSREDYEALLSKRPVINARIQKKQISDLNRKFQDVQQQGMRNLPETIRTHEEILVEMKNVTVEWSDHKVLDNLSWTLYKNEHWLIRGPNGSGKTTLLELITGDNPQVFRNNISLFGSRRGSGETIWELKEKIGVVSYRLHVEYRGLGHLSLESVILSGLHDSIGLYQQCGEEERELAKKWLSLTGFANREGEHFRNLSFGEQQAILIARASIKCPPILILDEPCHGLDENSRRRILTLLQAIAESGTSTILHVTHDSSEILPCEKHILELQPGKDPMYKIFVLS